MQHAQAADPNKVEGIQSARQEAKTEDAQTAQAHNQAQAEKVKAQEDAAKAAEDALKKQLADMAAKKLIDEALKRGAMNVNSMDTHQNTAKKMFDAFMNPMKAAMDSCTQLQ
jgi:colicin import membrane protein